MAGRGGAQTGVAECITLAFDLLVCNTRKGEQSKTVGNRRPLFCEREALKAFAFQIAVQWITTNADNGLALMIWQRHFTDFLLSEEKFAGDSVEAARERLKATAHTCAGGAADIEGRRLHALSLNNAAAWDISVTGNDHTHMPCVIPAGEVLSGSAAEMQRTIGRMVYRVAGDVAGGVKPHDTSPFASVTTDIGVIPPKVVQLPCHVDATGGSGTPARARIMEDMIRYIKGHAGVRFFTVGGLARWCLDNRQHFD